MPLEPFSPRYTEPNIKEGFRIRSGLDQTGKIRSAKYETRYGLNTGSELRDGNMSIVWVNPSKVRTDLNQKPLRCKPET